LELKVEGQGGHAGPTPMSLRRDALIAASKLIVHIEEKGKITDSELSLTVGRMKIKPDVVNCIPEEVIFSLDVRHRDDRVRKNLINELKKELRNISDEQNVKLEIKELWDVKTSYFHPKVVNQIADSAKKLGFSNKRMFSGAGHDANYLNQIAPTGMIFLISVEGKSHVESEL